MSLPNSVIQELEQRIQYRDREYAVGLLENCVKDLSPSDYREKILIGVIRLSGRSRAKLKEMVLAANEDHRNIDYWYWFAQQNRERLFQEGGPK